MKIYVAENTMEERINELVKKLADDAIDWVRFEVADLHGVSRSKIVPVQHVKTTLLKGQHMGLFPMTPNCNLVPLDYFSENGYPNSYLMPDLSTYCPIPWAPNTARFLCNMEGIFSSATARNLAVQQIDALESMGYRLLSGCELEFYLVDKNRQPVFDGINPYSTLKGSFDKPFLSSLLKMMRSVEIDICAAHAEFGPGQMEIVWTPSFGIKSADDAFTFKNAIKEISHDAGRIASFMTLPFAGKSGCGFHFGQSLWSKDEDQCLMYDQQAERSLSELALFWLEGQLRHAPALSALCAPTLNCSKRYQKGSSTPATAQRCPGAPTVANWGIENRTCLIRAIINGATGTYLENRLGSNPYLLLAGMVAAGIDGIKSQRKPPEPRQGAVTCSILKENVAIRVIPDSLEKALEALRADVVMTEALGQKFVDTFCAIKSEEIRIGKEAEGEEICSAGPTDWEREIYFENC